MQEDLKKLGVPVVLTAEDSVQATDAVASDQEAQSIAQRFQSAGVNVVDRCRRLRLDDLASCAAGQPEHLQAHVHRHQRVVADLLRRVDQGRQPVPEVRAGGILGADLLPAVEGPGDPEVCRPRSRRPTRRTPSRRRSTPPVPARATAPTRRMNRCSRPASTWRLFDDIADGGREEPDRGELHQGRLRAEERQHPRHRSRLVRTGPALRHRPGDHLQVRPHERDARSCVKLGTK